MPKYSFIIPVYKAEKYLDDCLTSVLKQSFKDYEIVLVDDGSPDQSGALCDQYAADHDNILVLHQKNAGASVARNNGLLKCNGDYVVFLDSDDFWVDTCGLEKIDGLFQEGADLVIFSSMDYKEVSGKFTKDRYEYPVEDLHGLSSESCLAYLIEHDIFNVHPGKRAYRKSFLLDHDLFFKPNVKSEDVDLGIRVANELPEYRFLNEHLYVYRHHDGSVTHSVDEKHLDNYLEIIKGCAGFTYKNEEVKELLLSYVAYQLILLIAYVEYVNPKNKKYFVKEIKKYLYLLKYRRYPRTTKIAKIYSVSGYFITSKILGKYLKGRFR